MAFKPALTLDQLGALPRRKRRRPARKGLVRATPPRATARPPAPAYPPPGYPAPQYPQPYAPNPAAPAALQPAPMTWASPGGGGWVRELAPVADAAMEVFDPGDDGEEAAEDVGAWPWARRPALPPPSRDWGPVVALGPTMRIQAARNVRAAVVPLRPGLYLVAEVPADVTRTEFGFAPLLAPLIVNAAKQAMGDPSGGRPGPFTALRRPTEVVRHVPVVAPSGETAVVTAPNLGWADDASVAAAFGCACCERRRS